MLTRHFIFKSRWLGWLWPHSSHANTTHCWCMPHLSAGVSTRWQSHVGHFTGGSRGPSAVPADAEAPGRLGGGDDEAAPLPAAVSDLGAAGIMLIRHTAPGSVHGKNSCIILLPGSTRVCRPRTLASWNQSLCCRFARYDELVYGLPVAAGFAVLAKYDLGGYGAALYGAQYDRNPVAALP